MGEEVGYASPLARIGILDRSRHPWKQGQLITGELIITRMARDYSPTELNPVASRRTSEPFRTVRVVGVFVGRSGLSMGSWRM